MSDKEKTRSELIAELTQMRQHFIDSEDKYRILVDNTQIPITYLTTDGYILLINRVGAENLGGTPEQFVGKSLHEVLSPMVEITEIRIAGIVKSGLGAQFEDLISLPEGERWFVSNFQPVKDADGRIFAIQITSTDNTERKQAEEELNEYRDHLEELVQERSKQLQEQIIKREGSDKKLGESKERFMSILENSPDFILEIDRDLKILYLNRPAPGHTIEAALGTSLLDYIIPEYRSQFTETIKQTFRNAVPVSMETAVNFPDGKQYTLEARFGPICFNDEVISVIMVAADITQRKQIEEALKRSEARFRSIFENVTDAILYVNLTGTIIDANQRIKDLCGCEPEELKGKSFTDADFLSVDSIDNIMRTLSETVINDVAPQPLHITINHRNGSKVIAETSPSMLEMEDGTRGILTVIRDITERKKAELALRESEEKYKTLTNNLNVGVYRNTPGDKGTFIEVNPAHFKMLGYESREEFLAVNVADMYQNPEERKVISRELTDKGFVKDRQVELKRKDGTLLIGCISAVAMKDEQGKVLYFDGVLEDITERKKAEQALRESEEKYRSLIENINDAIFSVDVKGYFTYASPVAERIWGYKVDEILGRHFTDFVVPDDLPELAASFERTLNGQVEPSDFRMIDKDGTIHYVRTSSRLLFQEGQPVGLTGIVTDITKRKQAEEELVKRNKNLIALNTIAQTMIQPLDLDSILNSVLDKIREILETNICFVSLLDDNDHLILRAQHGIPDKNLDMIKKWNLEDGLLGQVVRNGKPRIIDSIADFAENMKKDIAEIITRHPLGSVMYIPLRTKGRTLGALVCITSKDRLFTAEEQDLLLTIGHQLSIVVENTLLYERLQHEGDIRREGLRHAILAQEEERRRIARELHDQTSQILTGASAMIEAAVASLPWGFDRTKENLIQVRSSLTSMLVDVRNIIYELRPTLLDDLGLVAAARWQAQEFLERSGVKAEFETRGRIKKLLPQTETALFRIIQEATTNIVKHAQAKSARITIGFGQDSITLEIEDDGKGFILQEAWTSTKESRGLGLVSMRERTEIMGGIFVVDSQPGSGTRITVEVPCLGQIQ